jgi:ferredoxin
MAELKIDKDKRIGCGNCEFKCPDVFEISISSGKAEVKPVFDLEKQQECIDDCIKNCPTEAIYYEEE